MFDPTNPMPAIDSILGFPATIPLTPVQEIQAAIDKLTALKNEPIVTALFTATVADAEWFSRTSKKLAIFHRTINAQLTILRVALTVAGSEFPFRDLHEGLALARAINGPTQ